MKFVNINRIFAEYYPCWIKQAEKEMKTDKKRLTKWKQNGKLKERYQNDKDDGREVLR